MTSVSARALVSAAVLFATGAATPAIADSEDDARPKAGASKAYYELETKYLFGFTEGSDLGEVGERSLEFETTTALGRRFGRYANIDQQIHFETVPTKYFSYELSAHSFGYSVSGVQGLIDAGGFGFGGLSTELRFRPIVRGAGSPVGVTFSLEPEWARLDENGRPVVDLPVTLRAVVDTELVAERLYGSANLIYTPELSQSPGESWRTASMLGVTAALSYRVPAGFNLGGEIDYYRACDGLAAGGLRGQALYIGPTFFSQASPTIQISGSWSTQIVGRAQGETSALDLTNFPRHRGKFQVEFGF